MVALRFLLLTPVLGLIGCSDSFDEPISATPHGGAVRQNMAAQIIDPNPPARASRSSDAARAVLGVEAYRAGEVKDPTAQSTAPTTTDIE